MSLRKYASLENVQVLDLKGSPTRVRHASLGKLADFENYRTEDGYLYARIRAISSRVNKNHDGWPSIELAGGPDIFDRHLSSEGFSVTADSSQAYGFSTFLGKPIFIDHHNSDPSRARGAIVDAKFHVDDHKTSSLDPYYSSKDVDPEHLPGSWVELLLEVDAKSFPKFAKYVVEGGRNPKKGIDGWSMGCDVEKSVCSICKNAATAPDEYCHHIKLKGAHFDSIDSKGHKTSKKAYENCYGVKFFEISGVFDPADETALSREVRSKTANEDEPFDPNDYPPNSLENQMFTGGKGHCPECMGELGMLANGQYHCQACGYIGGHRMEDRMSREVRSKVSVTQNHYGDEYDYTCPNCSYGDNTEGGPLPSACPNCNISGYTMWNDDPDLSPYFYDPDQKASVAEAYQHQQGGGMAQTERQIDDLPETEHPLGRNAFNSNGDWDPSGEHQAAFERYAAKKEEKEKEESDTVPPKKTLNGLVDQHAEDLLEESGEEHLKRKKGGPGERPRTPGNAFQCPNCAGNGWYRVGEGGAYSENCPTCSGRGYFAPPHPGSDDGQAHTSPIEIQPSVDAITHPDMVNLGPVHQGSSVSIKLGQGAQKFLKTAENPLPQAEMSHAPEKVDTLREETTCPVCGSSMDEDTCDVCGYQEEPDGFGNPDLTKAKDVDLPEADQAPELPPVDPAQIQPGQQPQDVNTPSNPTSLAHVTNDVPKTSARINKVEQPVVASDKPATNEPKEKIISDQLRPVTSRVRTAQDFIAAAGATRRNTEMKHTADGTSAEAVSAPDVKTEVVGVGGVDQASNEAASKADAQIDVTGIGEAGTASVSADQEGVNVEQGDEHSKNIEAIPTKTWSDGQGDSLGQHDPVTSEPFPASADGVHATSNWHVMGYDDAPFPDDEIEGGTAVRGVKPHSETFGERVDVLDHVTSPSNNSGPTKTWSGTDGNGVLKQQDPVTNESIALGESGVEGAPNWTSSTHIFAAFKLADMEIEMGLLPGDKKYSRAAELEKESPAVLAASLAYAQRVRTARQKVAGTKKLPVMGRSNEEKVATVETPDSTEDDSFMFGGV